MAMYTDLAEAAVRMIHRSDLNGLKGPHPEETPLDHLNEVMSNLNSLLKELPRDNK